MIVASVADFWRRRKVVIIIGVAFICLVAVFVHVRVQPFKGRSSAARNSQKTGGAPSRLDLNKKHGKPKHKFAAPPPFIIDKIKKQQKGKGWPNNPPAPWKKPPLLPGKNRNMPHVPPGRQPPPPPPPGAKPHVVPGKGPLPGKEAKDVGGNLKKPMDLDQPGKKKVDGKDFDEDDGLEQFEKDRQDMLKETGMEGRGKPGIGGKKKVGTLGEAEGIKRKQDKKFNKAMDGVGKKGDRPAEDKLSPLGRKESKKVGQNLGQGRVVGNTRQKPNGFKQPGSRQQGPEFNAQNGQGFPRQGQQNGRGQQNQLNHPNHGQQQNQWNQQQGQQRQGQQNQQRQGQQQDQLNQQVQQRLGQQGKQNRLNKQGQQRQGQQNQWNQQGQQRQGQQNQWNQQKQGQQNQLNQQGQQRQGQQNQWNQQGQQRQGLQNRLNQQGQQRPGQQNPLNQQRQGQQQQGQQVGGGQRSQLNRGQSSQMNRVNQGQQQSQWSRPNQGQQNQLNHQLNNQQPQGARSVMGDPVRQSKEGGGGLLGTGRKLASTGTGGAPYPYVKTRTPIGTPPSMKRTKRQEAVVQAFKHAWKAYTQYAWGKDEVNPISHTGSATLFNMGLTIVDSLDTLWIMGLREEYERARGWVSENLDIERNSNTVSVFECTIRILGGLLGIFHLTGDKMYLEKATKLGTRLLPAFSTPSKIPASSVNIHSGSHGMGTTTVAEAGTLQLEFRDLYRATGNITFKNACDNTIDKILSVSAGHMVPMTIDVRSGQFGGRVYSAGAGIDSYYEYLLKQWLQSGKRENKFRDAYIKSTREVLKNLVGTTRPHNLAYLGTKHSIQSQLSTSMDHLSCFYPGMLALGVLNDVMPEARSIAKNLTHTCYYMYNITSPTHLAPEIFRLNVRPGQTNDAVRSSDPQNIQRPETVESLFYLYRLTNEEKYRYWAWKVFEAFQNSSKLEGAGFVSLTSVYTPRQYKDRMESFFLSETLKYLYLIFGEDSSFLSLDEWVFNTEAHPLPIWNVT